MYKLNKVQFFFFRTENFLVEHKLLPGHNIASSGLRNMLTWIIFNTLDVWVLVCPAVFYGHCGKWQPHCNDWCYSHCIVLADVAIHHVGRCYTLDLWHMLLPHNVVLCGRWKLLWQMLWPCVLRKWQMLLPNVSIFLRPEKAMLWLGKSFSSTGKMFCSREKIELCSAYTLKQNRMRNIHLHKWEKLSHL